MLSVIALCLVWIALTFSIAMFFMLATYLATNMTKEIENNGLQKKIP